MRLSSKIKNKGFKLIRKYKIQFKKRKKKKRKLIKKEERKKEEKDIKGRKKTKVYVY